MKNEIQKLLESKNELNTLILDSLPVALFCKDYTEDVGIFTVWNKKAEVIWGLKENEVLGKTDFDFFPDSEAKFFQEKDLETINSNKEVYIEEEDVTSPTLGKRIVRTWKVPLTKGDHRTLLGISQDITEQKVLEIELEKEKRKSIQSFKLASLGEMAAGVAHEINNPLSIIYGSSQAITRKPEDIEKVKGMNIKINSAVERIIKIVNGLKKFARKSEGVNRVNCNLTNIIDESVAMMQAKLKHNEINLIIDNVDDIDINIDEIQIEQVLINLLSNSIDSIAEITNPWIKIKTELEPENIKIILLDSGAGIDEEVISKIFDPFYTTKDVGKGTGLGLSISKGIAEDHGGDLNYQLIDGNTAFVLTLPLVK